MTCSAISLGCSRSSAPIRRSSSSVRPRRRVPAIGREMTLSPSSLHHRLRRRAHDQGQLGQAHEVHVRARVHLAQHAVVVERDRRRDRSRTAGPARPGRRRRRGCAPWPPRRPARYAPAPIDERTSGSSSSTAGGSTSGSCSGCEPSSGELLEPAHRLVVDPIQLVVGGVRWDAGVRDERDPLAEVVEGGQLADDRQHGVGIARRRPGVRRAGARPRARRRSRGSPSSPPCSGGSSSSCGDRYRSSTSSIAARMPVVEADPLRYAVVDGDVAPASHERGCGTPAHERPPAPPLAVLDRLEQEARLVLTGQAGRTRPPG